VELMYNVITSVVYLQGVVIKGEKNRNIMLPIHFYVTVINLNLP